MIRRIAPFALLVLSGCATIVTEPSAPNHPPGVETTEPPPVTSIPRERYEPEAGREATTIADLRAAPAPATPQVIVGSNASGERDRQASQGYVRIGTGYYPMTEPEARDSALRQGIGLGADRIVLYAPLADSTAPEWVAEYYVRFKLLFGATFRDLRAQERETLSAQGGVVIGKVVGGTPASRSNLIPGDVVLAVDGRPFGNRAEFQDALRAAAGRQVTLTIVRNGETLSRVVRLGASANAGS